MVKEVVPRWHSIKLKPTFIIWNNRVFQLRYIHVDLFVLL